jgi:Tfp pilus assembly protein PilN
MIRLNLLPNSTKRQIAKDIRQIGLINNTIVITIVLVLISIAMLASQRYLSYKTESINQVEEASSQELSVSQINRTIAEVRVMQQDYVKWSRIIQNFLVLIPENNKLHGLKFDKTNRKLYIQGLATTREAFLDLEENLEASDLVIDLKSPISNLLHQVDINFNLEATLNL